MNQSEERMLHSNSRQQAKPSQMARLCLIHGHITGIVLSWFIQKQPVDAIHALTASTLYNAGVDEPQPHGLQGC